MTLIDVAQSSNFPKRYIFGISEQLEPLQCMLSCYISPTGHRYAFFGQHPKMGIVGYGRTIEKAFEGAACAMFALVVDPSRVRAVRTAPIGFIERNAALALITWLDLLLKSARDEKVIFSRFSIRRLGALWRGCAGGRPSRKTADDVGNKIAQRKNGSVKRRGCLWQARCLMIEDTATGSGTLLAARRLLRERPRFMPHMPRRCTLKSTRPLDQSFRRRIAC